jgi:hypothetical protein
MRKEKFRYARQPDFADSEGNVPCDPDGRVIAWAVDEPWALIIAGVLNRVEEEGLCGPFGVTDDGDGLYKPRDNHSLNQQEEKQIYGHD